MSLPNPALVTQRAARRVPRIALALFCAAYLLPGLFGRDPWKNADVSAFGAMLSIAEGRSGWLTPTLGGLAVDGGLLPYWLGAAFIRIFGPVLDPALAARLPFALLLVATLALVWYATAHLAHTEAAQPVPFAFGGEAPPVDYSRAIADGALLALIATLGLLQLGHETTPELAQLFGVALFLWSLSAAPYRVLRARLAAVASLCVMADSGAPAMALALGAIGTLICARSSYPQARRLVPWVGAATLLAIGVGVWSHGWAVRIAFRAEAGQVVQALRLLAWFCWPAWPLALWTLWRWRYQLTNRHISIPLGSVLVALGASIAMGGSDRALLLGLPGLAMLAAFALPTFKRSTGALLDWFSMFFYTACAIAMWVIYASMFTGIPAKPAQNVAKLAPGFVPAFSAAALLVAIAGTVAWVALVRWRTARHQHALWKTMLLPAGGVALCWLLVMTLGLPVLDYARSYRPLVERVQALVPRDACIAAPGLTRAQVAALEVFGDYRVLALDTPERTACRFLMLQGASTPPPAGGWVAAGRVSRPTDRNEVLAIFSR